MMRTMREEKRNGLNKTLNNMAQPFKQKPKAILMKFSVARPPYFEMHWVKDYTGQRFKK